MNTDGGVWQIFSKGSALKIRTSDQDVLDLMPFKADMFGFRYKLWGLLPLPVDELKPLRLRELVPGSQYQLSSGGFLTVIVGRHFSPIKPVPIDEVWRRRVGTYKIDNPDSDLHERARKAGKSADIDLRFDQASGFLQFNDVPMRPLNASQAVSMGRGRDRGETVEVLVDGRLFFSGYYLSRIP